MARKLKWFTITVPVTKVQGHQEYEVRAHDLEDAKGRFARGKAVHVRDEIEVYATGEPEFCEEK